MKTYKFAIIILALALLSISARGQTATPLLKRTTYKTDRFDFGVGGIVAVIGAPKGSIRVEGWDKREIEISAEINVQAETEADLKMLSEITGFILQEELGRSSITSVGVNDKKYLKQIRKKLPKTLLSLPYSIDYVIKVPRYSDLQINGGNGDLNISGIDGTIRVDFLETNARIDLVGGSITATFGKGTVNLTIPTRSWRGRFVDVQIATGTLNVALPTGLNATVDASILRTGAIENKFGELVPRVRKAEFTEKSIVAKSGSGTIPLKFTVGDGVLRMSVAGLAG